MEELNKVYVGNLNFKMTEDELKQAFEEKALKTKSVSIIKDKYSQRSKGFGFVEFETKEEVEKAIEALNGTEVGGRKLMVSQARAPKRDNFGGGGDSSGPRTRGNW